MHLSKRLIVYPTLSGMAGLALLGLTGCAALSSTTNTAARAAETLGEAVSKVSQTSTNVSVTEPNVPRYARARVYVASQLPMIRREAATGGGENIRALATLMNEADARAFGAWMQANYTMLFNDLDKPATLVRRIAEQRG